MKQAYITKKFRAESLERIAVANSILEEYARQGFDLTLRQLYYQFVARGYIPNRQEEYDRLGSLINDARLAGLVDWDHIVDRTRNLRENPHWTSPSSIIRSAALSFQVDKWATQPCRVECWIEKDALVGVIAGICNQLDVPYFSCRGYTSQSELRAAAMRMRGYARGGQEPVLLHLGDHDPSGIDMTRDIGDRFAMFMGGIEVRRLALNFDQIELYDPPPNPAKQTDARFASYVAQHGDESWELDALEPTVIEQLVEDAVRSVIDEEAWEEAEAEEGEGKSVLTRAAVRWDEVAELLAK